MNKPILALLAASALSAGAQSVSIAIVANDGSTTATNVMQVPAVRVQGLLAMWADDSKSKTNAGVAALTFGQFIVQELRDKGADHATKGAVLDMQTWGITNAPAKLVSVWPTLSLVQKTNAANYIKQIGE